MPFIHNQFYYIILGLQAICVIHCIRKGKQNTWIWVIVLLPVAGAIAYIVTEVISGREIRQVQSGIGTVFNQGGRIKRLEQNLKFSDTFANKVELADACLAAGQTDRAIGLYESSLTGTFVENEHVLIQLIIAYFDKERYEELIAIARKVYKLPQFARSRPHMLYAMALEYTGEYAAAEKEFRMMKVRFSYFESRYQYGLFLERNERPEDAKHIFAEMVDEGRHLSAMEKRGNRIWINKARDALKRMAMQPSA